jgi:hypothetical protein
MGPGFQAGEQRAADERLVGETMAEKFPEWEWSRVFGGYRAVPKGTPVVESVSMRGLLAKLIKRRDEAAGAGS